MHIMSKIQTGRSRKKFSLLIAKEEHSKCNPKIIYYGQNLHLRYTPPPSTHPERQVQEGKHIYVYTEDR